MAEISLTTVKVDLMAKRGYTTTPGHSQLEELRALVNNMLAVRRQPLSGGGPKDNIYGSVCTGHTTKTTYDGNLSLADIADFNDSYILPCACDVDTQKGCECVSAIDCKCQSRTSCGCVSRNTCSCDMEACACNTTYCPWNCDCESRGSMCGCNSNNCGCHTRFAGSDVTCEWDVTPCSCEMTSCTCQSQRQNRCEGFVRYPSYSCDSNCGCQSRATSCDGRVSSSECPTNVSCTCNTRCACNAVRTFY